MNRGEGEGADAQGLRKNRGARSQIYNALTHRDPKLPQLCNSGEWPGASDRDPKLPQLCNSGEWPGASDSFALADALHHCHNYFGGG